MLGLNSYGQLGNGTTTGSPAPVLVSGITNAVAVTAGGYHTCVVLNGGSVQCWGYNSDGQLGTSTSSMCNIALPCYFTPLPVSGIGSAVAVSGGGAHTCAMLNGGSVQCWGSNGVVSSATAPPLVAPYPCPSGASQMLLRLRLAPATPARYSVEARFSAGVTTPLVSLATHHDRQPRAGHG